MNTVTFIILCWYEHQQNTGNVKNIIQSTHIAYHFFKIFVPSGTHACQSHVSCAVNGWVTNKEQSQEVNNLGDSIMHMLVHIVDQVMSVESVRDVMILLFYMIDLLSRDQVELRTFNLSSPICKHHNYLEWFCYRRE